MVQRLYLAGSALTSAVDHHALGETVETTNVCLSVDGQNMEIPFYAIADHPLHDNEQRLLAITEQVIHQAIKEAGWGDKQLSDCAVFIGSTSYSLYAAELLYQRTERHLLTESLGLTDLALLANHIQQLIPKAQLFTFNTACTSSANALLYAAKMIRAGVVRHALVIGLEFYNSITLLGFNALGLISKSKQMQPFGLNRDGLILGEACSAIALSGNKPNKPCVEFIHGATQGDNYSMTAANPDGSVIEQVIRQALNNAKIQADDIAAVKLHGTASLANDDAEFAGLQRIYGDDIPPACSLKPMLGHTLGACGSNELVLLQRYLLNKSWPIAADYPIDPALPVALNKPFSPTDNSYYLLNFFGFGGSNTALVVRQVS